MLQGLKWLNKGHIYNNNNTHTVQMKEDVGSASVLESTNGVQFSLWRHCLAPAGSRLDQIGSIQLRSPSGEPGVAPRRFGRVKNQLSAVYFCCCCLRLSSRICLWAGSSTPASSRSSSVMSLEKKKKKKNYIVLNSFFWGGLLYKKHICESIWIYNGVCLIHTRSK